MILRRKAWNSAARFTLWAMIIFLAIMLVLVVIGALIGILTTPV